MLGIVNGVNVSSVQRVPWLSSDDVRVLDCCESRGLVLCDGGGRFDAVVVDGVAIIWEREGRRFRAFPVENRKPSQDLFDASYRVHRAVNGTRLAAEEHRGYVALALHASGVLNATARMVRDAGL